MSTTTQRMIVEREFIDFLMENYREQILETWTHITEAALYEGFEDGIIQVETLIEKAIEIIGKKERNSINGMDFTDGSDAKKCTLVSEKSGYKRFWYSIKKVSAKIGKLRIMAWNFKLRKFDYFIIPKFAYKDVENIKIAVDKYTYVPIGKYSKWQVASFEAMATL